MIYYRFFIGVLLLSGLVAVHCDTFVLGTLISTPLDSFDACNFTTYLGSNVTSHNSLLLTTSATATGVAVYPQPMTVDQGWTTTFYWNATDCSTSVNLLAETQYTDGVSFFISETNPDVDLVSSAAAFMGIASLPNTVSFGYVTSLNEFHVCDWQEPPAKVSPFFRRNCVTIPYKGPRFTCGVHNFKLVYNDTEDSLLMQVDGLVLNTPLLRKFRAVPHYIGFAAGSDTFARQQEIKYWAWGSVSIVTEFTQNSSTYLALYGSAMLEEKKRVSVHATGMAVLGFTKVLLQQQFSTKWRWTSRSCPEQYTEDEGFALLFTTSRPASIYFYMPSAAGLGIPFRNNVSFVGYNFAHNEFYVCGWTTPRSELLGSFCPTFPNPLPRFACGPTYAFEVQSDDNMIKVSVNGVFLFATMFTLDPTQPYIMGFSAAGRMTQYFSKWSFKSTPNYVVDLLNIYYPQSFKSINNSISLFGTANYGEGTTLNLNSKLYNLPNDTVNVGGLVFNTPFPAHNGFTTNFDWVADRQHGLCDEDEVSSDGLTIFLTTDESALQMQNLTYTGIGLRDLQNVITLTYNAFDHAITVCQWTTFENDTLIDFKLATEYCTQSFIAIPLCFLFTDRAWSFEVKFQDELLTLYTDTFITHPMTLTPGLYYLGVIASDHDQMRNQYLQTWHIDYHEKDSSLDYFTFSLEENDQHFVPYGSAWISDQEINTANYSVGLAIHQTPVPAHLGFVTTFSWQPTCDVASGFSFFLTTTSPDSIIVKSDSVTGLLGTSVLSKVTSLSYNHNTNEFKAYFNSTLASATKVTTFIDAMGLECDRVHQVVVQYTQQNEFKFFVDTFNPVWWPTADRTLTVINPDFYYVGLSAFGGTLSNWKYISVAPVKQQIDFGFTNSSELDLLGTASIIDDKLRLTTGGSESGVAMYTSIVYAHAGFTSNLTWTPTNCDAANNGADGFTLFLTKTHPLHSEVYMSSGGLLGVGSMSNVVMFAYSATYNEFYVCDWNIPLEINFRYSCSHVIPAPGPKMTCPNTYIFSYSYDHQTFTLSVNGTQQLAVSLMLEPVPYFVGLSGATGGGYFQQDVSDWSFESIAL